MSFIKRVIADFKENIGEGNRWHGRTQSSVSWSPEQLNRERRLQVEFALSSEVQPQVAESVRSDVSTAA
jgi:hypothetical protein